MYDVYAVYFVLSITIFFFDEHSSPAMRFSHEDFCVRGDSVERVMWRENSCC